MLAQVGDRLDQLAPREAELRAVAARGFPAAGAARRQARPHADARPDLGLLGDALDEPQLGRLLDHQDDRAAELRGQERGLDVLLVLVAVADDERLLVLEQRHDRQELGLRARLEAEVVGPAVLDDPLDQVALLVDLDRIDAAVAPLVAVLLDGARERFVELDDPRLEDVREAHQERRADAALAHLVDELFQVDRRRAGAARVHDHMPQVVNREVVVAPAADVVEVDRVSGGPASGRQGVRRHRRRVAPRGPLARAHSPKGFEPGRDGPSGSPGRAAL